MHGDYMDEDERPVGTCSNENCLKPAYELDKPCIYCGYPVNITKEEEKVHEST